MKEFKKLLLIISMTLITSCGIHWTVGTANSMQSPTQISSMRTSRAINNIFSDPYSYRFNINQEYWVECRLHGEHDLNHFDISYNPIFCRPFNNFSIWNSRGNNIWWNSRWRNSFRFNRFGYNRGFGLGNVYGNYFNGYTPYHGWNTYYNTNGRRIFNGRRSTNRSGRWESTTPVRRVNPRSIRTIRTSTPTKIKPIKRNRTNIPNTPRRTNIRSIIKPNRQQRTNIRSTRSNNTTRTTRNKRQ